MLVLLASTAIFTSLALAGEPTSATIVSVYDGDTFTLNTGDKVRLRGINTPELRPAEAYGIEARDAVRDLVMNQKVTLIYGGPPGSNRDAYDRLVASVRFGDIDLSTYLLERGLGHLFVFPGEDMDIEAMKTAQNVAKATGIGMWSIEAYSGDLHITSFHANGIYGDDRTHINGEYLRVCNVSARPIELEGFTIRSNANSEGWTFPSLILPVGYNVKIYSGTGRDQIDPESQLEIYLGNSSPIWNDCSDVATIRDRYERVVDIRKHKPKKCQ
ncbi:MAG: endonuclease YncB(thermonuclease family) [Myxococcota bacterium]|jgi:endonuclease YncB( thermonuclease family)